MLLKYRPQLPLVKPYIEVGYVPRHIGGSYTGMGYNVNLPTGARTTYTEGGKWSPDVSHGIAAGGGVEFGGRHLRVTPELRYTRWNNDPIGLNGSQGYSVSAARNRLEVLVGIVWHR